MKYMDRAIPDSSPLVLRMLLLNEKRRRTSVCSGILIIIGCLFIIGAIVATTVYNTLIGRLIKLFPEIIWITNFTYLIFIFGRFVLSHDEFYTEKYSIKLHAWRDFYGAEFYTKFHFYNLTNKDSLGWWSPYSTPVWKEMGPYVYKEKRQRFIIKRKGIASDKVRYQVKRTFSAFVPELSQGQENDIITMPFPPLMHRGNAQIFTSRTVREWLWGFKGEEDISFGFYKDLNGTSMVILCSYSITVSYYSTFSKMNRYLNF